MSTLHDLAGAAGRHLLAARAPTYGTSGISTWLQNNVVTLLIVLIGVALLLAAHKANVSKVIMTVGLGLVALFWLGLASTGATKDVGAFLVHLVRA
jgi:hypothetical protein